MKQIDVHVLMAYVDGELDLSERQWVEQALAESPELQAQVKQLSQLDTLLGTAYNDALYRGQPPLRALEKRKQSSTRGQFTQVLSSMFSWRSGSAIAVLLVGVLIGGWYERQSMRAEMELSQQKVQQMIDRALETHLSHDPLQWSSDQPGSGGSITPIRTYKNAQGQYCREFVERRQQAGQTIERRGVACRSEQGWQLKANYYL